MTEEKTITVTLESGGPGSNPVTTQPSLIQGHMGYGPAQGGYGIQVGVNAPQPGGYGVQPGANAPQHPGYAIQPGINPTQPGYGVRPGLNPPPQPGVNPPSPSSFGPPSPNSPPQSGYGVQPGINPPPQSGFGGPPGANLPPQSGYGIQPGVNPPPQPGYGNYGQHQPPGNFPPPPGGNYNTNGAHVPGGPSNDNWMMRPQNIQNCPPGLEYLTTMDTLIVNQVFNLAEALADREPENEFVVTNTLGQKVYYAKEESDDCSRKFCGSRRAFRMKVFDNFGNQVMDLSRPIACQACCFPCCLQKMEISAPPGTVVGLIHQEWAFLHPTFAIKGPTGDTILRIQGPWCTMNCYADVEFKVLTSDGANEVGKISKRWSGYANENSAKMDVFGISFPMDLDVRMKAVMLGACFLIDMMYFEQSVTNPNKTNARAQNNAPQHQELKPL
ncbi:hypothetical protein RN001_010544 [Aquatica leii]|uniref:Phospholipid scramblase n=1 Tax=Aquatica leii TaxID=1421715 RepID=A0AAN7SNC5_9COLE|nr:hypothetical protein RN001_010544 [Aquatica leii]